MLPPDYPADYSNYTRVNGRQMHFLEARKDKAEAVVMVHGNPSWSLYYRGLFNALKDQYHCVVPDHVGMGLSEKPGDDYSFTLKQRVDDLDALLTELNIKENLTLIVHDWGGMIGLAYATRYPERIKRLVISNTAGFLIPAGKQIPWQLKLSRTPILGKLAIQGFNGFCRGAVKDCVTRRPMQADVAAAYMAPHDSWAHRLSVLRFVEDIPLSSTHVSYEMVKNVDDHLQQFASLPMLICWGMNDFVFDKDFLAEWKRRFPDAEYHEYDAGHYLLEDAGDEVIPVIKEFLQQHPLP